ALTYVKDLIASGSAAFAADLGAGWGGEALGKGLAAMVIEGNWITGAMSSDYADVAYQAVELPAGLQKGTLQFTNAWGLATDGDNKEKAIELVEFLTSTEQQLAFADAFGVMPSATSAGAAYRTQFPQMAAFLAGADYAQNLPAAVGVAQAITDFNSTLGSLPSSDPQALLTAFQTNLSAALR
ncbi:MAG: extracellular solute-binding protein, partial [Propionibacteriaceae bacterium]|nr:extracellular solute-binding protein [Propionibacteriaceae bacterium]